MDSNILKVNELDIKQNSFILIVSKRMSGKSVLTRNLIYELHNKYNYDSIILISETAQFNNDYNFIPKNSIFKFNRMTEIIQKILDYQENKIKSKKENFILLILDDVILNKKSDILNEIATLGRHYKITCICSVQYCKGLISSSIRNNLDYIFFSDIGYIQIEALYEVISVNIDKQTFKSFIDENNNNYQFILYDSREKMKKDRLKIVKADLMEIEFLSKRNIKNVKNTMIKDI